MDIREWLKGSTTTQNKNEGIQFEFESDDESMDNKPDKKIFRLGMKPLPFLYQKYQVSFHVMS